MRRQRQKTISIVINDERKEFTFADPPVRKDGRYYVTIPTDYDEYGHIQYHYVYGSDELSLRLKIVEFFEKLNKKDPKQQSVRDAMDNWLHDVKFFDIKSTSLDTMEETINRYIYPSIGDIKVVNVTGDDLQKVINDMVSKGFSYSTINQVYVHLKDFFNYVHKKKRIKDNPMDEVKKPSKSKVAEIRMAHGKTTKTEKRYLTLEQVKAIQNVIYNGYTTTAVSRAGTVYEQPGVKFIYQGEIFDFMIQTGLRASEMCALQYSDWNQSKKTITINNNRIQHSERDAETHQRTGLIVTGDYTPKTESSKDTIRLSDYAHSILLKLKAKEDKNYTGYIVHTEAMKPTTKDGLRGRWHRLLCAAGIEHKEQIAKQTLNRSTGEVKIKKKTVIKEEYGLHTMRHTYASFLYASTQDMLLVSKKLRHTDPAFTARIYVDIIKDYEDNIDADLRI